MAPRDLGVAAGNGTIDAGLMAVADWFREDGSFELIEPELGVAASEHVRSVILFSNENPGRLDGRRVAVTRESSTSRRLAQLLAVAYWKADIEWIPEDELFFREIARSAFNVAMGALLAATLWPMLR